MASDAPALVYRMRIEIDPSRLEQPRWPPGVCARAFTPSDAEALHSLLVRGYRRGGGSVAEFGVWLPEMTRDEEYDAALWLLAEARTALVGAVLCWTSGFVKDLVVDESWRSRGLGMALMRQALATLAERGVGRLELKVHADNASAIRLYERVGMRVVERIGEG
jgi:ribosomal protein S18 acetylase RimI-like enzyme